MSRRRQITTVVFLALAVRLLLALIATDNIDVQNYRRVADALNEHGIYGLYVETPNIYPYPPVWMRAELIADWLANALGGSYSFWVRLPIVLADVLIVGILAAWQARTRNAPGLPAAWFYAVNPGPIPWRFGIRRRAWGRRSSMPWEAARGTRRRWASWCGPFAPRPRGREGRLPLRPRPIRAAELEGTGAADGAKRTLSV